MRALGVAAILAALTMPAMSADLTPGAIRAMLASGDATDGMPLLDDGSWTAFLAHVETGDRGWIDLVPLLAPRIAPAMQQSLTATLSLALKSNPAGVLSVLAADHYSPTDICADPDTAASTFETVAFIDEVLVKVAAVMDPALSQARDACLHTLSDARISALIRAEKLERVKGIEPSS